MDLAQAAVFRAQHSATRSATAMQLALTSNSAININILSAFDRLVQHCLCNVDPQRKLPNAQDSSDALRGYLLQKLRLALQDMRTQNANCTYYMPWSRVVLKQTTPSLEDPKPSAVVPRDVTPLKPQPDPSIDSFPRAGSTTGSTGTAATPLSTDPPRQTLDTALLQPQNPHAVVPTALRALRTQPHALLEVSAEGSPQRLLAPFVLEASVDEYVTNVVSFFEKLSESEQRKKGGPRTAASMASYMDEVCSLRMLLALFESTLVEVEEDLGQELGWWFFLPHECLRTLHDELTVANEAKCREVVRFSRTVVRELIVCEQRDELNSMVQNMQRERIEIKIKKEISPNSPVSLR
jgi:hypothetical protein